MKLPLRNIQRLLLVFIVSVGTILACNFERTENKISKLDKNYIIDSKTILDKLLEGNTNVFIALKDATERGLASQNEPVTWSQADYFLIADALHQFVWNETLNEMDLYWMHFSLNCNETSIGFQYGQFMFFRIIKTDEMETRITHGMEIDPRKNAVVAWETEYYPNLADWKSIDLTKVMISADQALQIAEKDGGQEKRVAVDDACDISVGISRDTVVYDGWIVTYSPSIFLDKIDPSTGK